MVGHFLIWLEAMIKEIKKSLVRELMPVRLPNSHKGQNGRVLIVGGSLEYHGAPILSALGAMNCGVDLVYLFVPECNFEVSRAMYPDFIVRKFKGDFLTEEECEKIIEFGKKKVDSVVIGPGLGGREASLLAVKKILMNLHLPTVLDADAISVLKMIERFPLEQTIVVTPHRAEFANLVDRDIEVKEDDPKSVILLRSLSMDLQINVLLKGPKDFVSSHEGFVEKNLTGNAGMTVGGTGDVLAGVVGAFLAKGLNGYDAARVAAYLNGVAGDLVAKQKGLAFLARDVAMALAYAIKN